MFNFLSLQKIAENQAISSSGGEKCHCLASQFMDAARDIYAAAAGGKGRVWATHFLLGHEAFDGRRFVECGVEGEGDDGCFLHEMKC